MKTYKELCLQGNVVCVFVFNHKSVDLKQSFSNILKCLSIFDIFFLVKGSCKEIDCLVSRHKCRGLPI